MNILYSVFKNEDIFLFFISAERPKRERNVPIRFRHSTGSPSLSRHSSSPGSPGKFCYSLFSSETELELNGRVNICVI